MRASNLPKKQPMQVSCFQICENILLILYLHVQKDLETLENEVAAEEAEMSDERQRLDAQRAIEFYEELGSELASLFCCFTFQIAYCFAFHNFIVCKRSASYYAAFLLSWRRMYQNRDRSSELGHV